MLQTIGTGGKTKVSSQAEGKNEAIVLVEVMGPRHARDVPESKNQSHLVLCKGNLHLVEALQQILWEKTLCRGKTSLPYVPVLLGWHSHGLHPDTHSWQHLLAQMASDGPPSANHISNTYSNQTRSSAMNHSRFIVHRAISKLLWPKHLGSALKTRCPTHSYQAM